jgi:hypothetical protein
MKDFKKINESIDLAALVFIFVGVVMQVSVYAILSIGLVWLLVRGFTALAEM